MMNIWISYFIVAHKLPFGRAGEKKQNSSDIRPRGNYAVIFYTLNEHNIC